MVFFGSFWIKDAKLLVFIGKVFSCKLFSYKLFSYKLFSYTFKLLELVLSVRVWGSQRVLATWEPISIKVFSNILLMEHQAILREWHGGSTAKNG